MSELVEQAMAQHEASTQTSPSETVQTQSVPAQSTPQGSPEVKPLDNIFELDKAETVKWNGQVYKKDDLQKAFMLQSDYTKKTQGLAKEKEDFKKSFEQDEKFYRNFYIDAENVRGNPSLAAEFIKMYPTKFHKELQDYLNQSTAQAPQEHRQSGPNVELLSKVEQMEKFIHEQNVAKTEVEIKSQLEKFSKKYPDAVEEMVIGRVYESYNKTKERPTEETWENAFKAVDEFMKGLVKSKYGDLVNKQTNANRVARDVQAGGGTPGKAPQQFNSLKDAIKFAGEDARSKQ